VVGYEDHRDVTVSQDFIFTCPRDRPRLDP